MLNRQIKIQFSEYSGLYDILIPQDHQLRRFLSLIDFSFVYDELSKKYCPDNGRVANDPVMMFKYLVLKALSGLSDEKLVERSRYDLSYKFFLGLMPEDNVIDSSSLTRFRRQRLADVDILDLLLNKTVEVAKEFTLIDGKTIIVDATHTLSKSSPLNQVESLQKKSKELRKRIYLVDESLKSAMPQKYEGTDLAKEIDYVKDLVKYTTGNQKLALKEDISEVASLLTEMVSDIEDHYTISNDKDARVGHKTANSEFFGYKTHIAMTPERIITAATITSGEKGDGPELPDLIDKTKKLLPDLERVVGDGAYAGQHNLENAEENHIEIVAKVNPKLFDGSDDEKNGFTYNKDADRVVCPAGHLSYGPGRCKDKSGNDRITFNFSKKACRVCALRKTCISGKGIYKKISFPIKTEQQKKQIQFMDTEEFKRWSRERYKIEAKNAELKHTYGYVEALYYGITGLKIQGAVALFTCNLSRIIRLLDEKSGK